ncbi:hypothetical protein GCM10010840_33560 [Deinococcus aerolatus]|uniref:Uncharacterized protein n=1 Tax=Deinococcus aerolatus TaxID=522487 RepID=A0ABQ2GFI4_9DEIO|nr:DUF11 domain-containing protein [Deinococcus aerolatus]GGL92723.1 hypothetical protein GCM10010840_33560 [Deinococcus aerolatus]
MEKLSVMVGSRFKGWRRSARLPLILGGGLLWLAASAAQAAPVLNITPLTWNVIGLDSNNQNAGPNVYPVGARVCNVGDVASSAVNAAFLFDGGTTNSSISLDPGSLSVVSLGSLSPGPVPAHPNRLQNVPDNCRDAYFNVRIARTSAAFSSLVSATATPTQRNTQLYHIEASATGVAIVSTPTPRELFVEKLVSQNRNSVASFTGPNAVSVGQTATYTLNASTAPGGYEQLENFPTLPNAVFQILNIATTYAAPTGSVNSSAYGDACGWENVINSVKYHNNGTCIGPALYTGGKVGSSMTSVYTVRILSGGTAGVYNAIYDFSGSSYHYNSDYGSTGNGFQVTASSPNLTLSKTHTGNFTVGQPGSFTFTVRATGADVYGTTTVTDSLPAGLSLPNGPVTLGGADATRWQCNSLSNTVTCTSTNASTAALMPAGGSSTFSITGVAVAISAVPSVTNTATVSNPNERAADTGDNSSSDPVAVTDSRLTIAKSFSPVSIQAGGTTTMTLSVSNPNATAVSALGLTDNVAATMNYPTPMNLRVTANTCGGTTSAPENTGGVLTLMGGTIAASASCTLTVAFTPWSPPLGMATNTIPAANVTGTVGGGTVIARAPASASLTITAGNAGNSYACDTNFYQTRQDPTTLLSNLYLLDLNNLGSGGIPQWTGGFGPALNATAYNPKDSYFYAVNIVSFNVGSPFRLYRLGKSGAVEYANLTNIPVGSSIAAAAVDRSGMMYIKKLQQDAVIYRYNLVTNAPAASLVLGSSAFLRDLAVSPFDGLLYGAVTPGGVYVIDPVTGAVSVNGTPTDLAADSSNAIGSLFFDQQNVLYGYQNGGAFGTINLTTGVFTRTATGSAAAQSDGASCAFGLPPSITLLKLGRNISVSPSQPFIGSTGSIGAKPGETVEYCIAYTNSGGAASNFKIADYVPVGMVAQLSAYGTGLGLKYAAGVVLAAGNANSSAVTPALTSASDSDAGSLTSAATTKPGTPTPVYPGLMTLTLPTLAAGGQGTVCFQAKVP